ncbi:hypothetical protein cyc_01566 [Cyclospora cayetanensis]|uniref:Uncharacterized protein n=1 Tax=Cyclospora cayetanensis TaxID=88456 RepID=A0A1D3CT90_9EIME|nr:hypothetical protein cyc_01566 [Cyclospora cayetanensis]
MVSSETNRRGAPDAPVASSSGGNRVHTGMGPPMTCQGALNESKPQKATRIRSEESRSQGRGSQQDGTVQDPKGPPRTTDRLGAWGAPATSCSVMSRTPSGSRLAVHGPQVRAMLSGGSVIKGLPKNTLMTEANLLLSFFTFLLQSVVVLSQNGATSTLTRSVEHDRDRSLPLGDPSCRLRWLGSKQPVEMHAFSCFLNRAL